VYKKVAYGKLQWSRIGPHGELESSEIERGNKKNGLKKRGAIKRGWPL